MVPYVVGAKNKLLTRRRQALYVPIARVTALLELVANGTTCGSPARPRINPLVGVAP